ncbi:substrate-binding domain-containing protein [Kistimonas asteriae]|uniref:substrate-binding domain-containing protein n=1 Tax=Kistimonas asteriae TaxID=517724 RepID=UPI001BA72054|nr:substrate-binding domain-containing protein [Kistimonas asteriae]
MVRLLLVVVLMAGVASLRASEQIASSLFVDPPDVLFTMQGSNTIGARLAPALVRDWLMARGFQQAQIQPAAVENEQRIVAIHSSGRHVTVNVKAHGSSSGFRALLNNEADMAASSRQIRKKERLALVRYGDLMSASSESVVGIDGIAVVVHPDNPLQQLNIDQVARIFSGEVSNWSELGGEDRPIVVHARDERSGTWDTFRKLVLGKDYPLTPAAIRFESNAVLSGRVTADRGAIGFVSLNTIGQAKALAIASGEARALWPGRLTVATEDYALARRLFFYLPSIRPNGYAQDFMGFAVSRQGQKVVDHVGYISQNVKPLSPVLDDEPIYYREQVDNHYRLSVNFRFYEGKAMLDNKALKDVERLASFLKEQPGRLLLVGFAETKGYNPNAKLLSRLRGRVVRQALIREGVPRAQVDVLGFGAYLALTDQQNNTGKVKNRRVEVWYRPDAKSVVETL